MTNTATTIEKTTLLWMYETMVTIRRFEEAVFMKTPLWRAALALDTDAQVTPAIRH